MDFDCTVEELLQKQVYLMDIFPKQIPADTKGDLFAVEAYFLEEKRAEQFAAKCTSIILKLSCYFPIQVYHQQWLEDCSCELLAAKIRGIFFRRSGFINVLLPEQDCLIQVDSHCLYLNFYHPNEEIQQLCAMLARSEGLFWRIGA